MTISNVNSVACVVMQFNSHKKAKTPITVLIQFCEHQSLSYHNLLMT